MRNRLETRAHTSTRCLSPLPRLRLPDDLAKQFDDAQIEGFKKEFDSYDLDASGTIDDHEVRLILKVMGEKINEKKLKDMISEIDEDGSGEIEFDEFVRMVSALKKDNSMFGMLRRASAVTLKQLKEEATQGGGGDGDGGGGGGGGGGSGGNGGGGNDGGNTTDGEETQSDHGTGTDGESESESSSEEEEEEDDNFPALGEFLRQHNLPSSYVELLVEAGFEAMSDLISIRKGELEAVSGIKRGHARKLERAVRKFRKALKK